MYRQAMPVTFWHHEYRMSYALTENPMQCNAENSEFLAFKLHLNMSSFFKLLTVLTVLFK